MNLKKNKHTEINAIKTSSDNIQKSENKSFKK